MDLQPLGDRVIVHRLEQEEVRGSGIVIPDTARDHPNRAAVGAVEQGCREGGERVAPGVEAGDPVVFGYTPGATSSSEARSTGSFANVTFLPSCTIDGPRNRPVESVPWTRLSRGKIPWTARAKTAGTDTHDRSIGSCRGVRSPC